MSIVASESVQQDEIRERVKRLQQLFADDPEVASIDYRLAQDWSGDDSIFIKVFLSSTAPSAEVVIRLSRQISSALFEVLRSEDLGLHAYFNFFRGQENGR
jgi:hypothetical protein